MALMHRIYSPVSCVIPWDFFWSKLIFLQIWKGYGPNKQKIFGSEFSNPSVPKILPPGAIIFKKCFKASRKILLTAKVTLNEKKYTKIPLRKCKFMNLSLIVSELQSFEFMSFFFPPCHREYIENISSIIKVKIKNVHILIAMRFKVWIFTIKFIK